MSLDVSLYALKETQVYERNITHNLGEMAAEAGLYEFLWDPEGIPMHTAKELVEPLRAGLKLLEDDPERFKKFNPGNGWGDYDGLVNFVREYLAACIKNPDAKVHAWR